MAFGFSRPLGNGFLSSGFASEHGFNAETFDFPATVNSAYGHNTDHPGPNDSPGAAMEASSTDVFQAEHGIPGYVGQYNWGQHYSTSPAPHSSEMPQSLSAPRDAGGVTGTNRLIKNAGPVESGSTEQWTGQRDELYSQAVGINGPISGGEDYSGQLMQAWAHANAAMIDQAAAEAAMVSAV